MALELLHDVSDRANAAAGSDTPYLPDRQLLGHIFGRVYGAVEEQGVEAVAFLPVGGDRPTCCVYAPGAVSDAAVGRWATAMRARAQAELGAHYAQDELTMWDNLAGESDGGAQDDTFEVRDRVLMMGERPMALLRIAGRDAEALRQASVWDAVGKLQPRFEAAEHVLTGSNTLQEPLLGTYSRAFLDDSLRRETARAYRHSQTLSLAIVRVEPARSKEGVAVAASWLRSVVAAVRDCVRETDIVASITAATMGVIMPATGTRNALVAAGRITQRVAEGRGLPEGIECHVGISGWDITGPHMPEIIEQATAAMNEAKWSGSDRPFLYLA